MPTFENFDRESTTDFRGVLNRVRSQAGINQIRGTNVAGSTGSGIPQHVTNVSASMANASTGSTSTITVTFSRNPADSAFGGVKVFVKGYQSNQSPTQVASSADSPVTFILNNTSEALSIAVQAFGNGGTAPLTTAPTVGVTLPKSTSGGVGTSTVTSGSAVSGSASAGQLAKFATPATTLTGANLTGDVVTSGSVATTVQKIQGTTISSVAPNPGDTLRYNEFADSKWDICVGVPRFVQVFPNQTAFNFTQLGNDWSAPTLAGTVTRIVATATERWAMKVATSAAGSVNVTSGIAFLAAGAGTSAGVDTFGVIQRYTARLTLDHTTNCRYWVGMTADATAFMGGSSALFASDTPAAHYACFRFSATTDTTIKAVCGTAAGSQTVVDTGVAIDTVNSQLLEIVPGATYKFYINGVLVASINTNLPSNTDLVRAFASGDNKNTATAVGTAIQHFTVIYR